MIADFSLSKQTEMNDTMTQQRVIFSYCFFALIMIDAVLI